MNETDKVLLQFKLTKDQEPGIRNTLSSVNPPYNAFGGYIGLKDIVTICKDIWDNESSSDK